MNSAMLIKVDVNDNPIGIISKTEAHANGILHRAFSVFIFNSEGKWLLQKRAKGKYHSGGLWTNACCSHPSPVEETDEAALDRLYFEMGIKCSLKKIFNFTYRAELSNGLIEHEFDHVFIGFSNENPSPDPDEVEGWKYVTFQELKKEMREHPSDFTEWFKMIYERVHEELKRF